MSDLAAYAAGVGTGMLMVAVVLFKLRHELAAGWRRLFEEPGEIAADGLGQEENVKAPEPAGSVEAPSRGRTRLAFAFHLFVTLCLLVAGLREGQVFLLILGAVGLFTSILYLSVERRYAK